MKITINIKTQGKFLLKCINIGKYYSEHSHRKWTFDIEKATIFATYSMADEFAKKTYGSNNYTRSKLEFHIIVYNLKI